MNKLETEFVDLVPFEEISAGKPWEYKLMARTHRDSAKVLIEFKIVGKIPMVDLGKLGFSAGPNRENFLWQHTCFEGFVGLPNDEKYFEFNVTPLGGWNFYRFKSYREDMVEDVRVPHIVSIHSKKASEYTVKCEIDFSEVKEVKEYWEKGDTLPLGLSAVIEMKSGEKTYCALKHCAKTPDFHLRESFSLRL
jgi:hypothetical protein